MLGEAVALEAVHRGHEIAPTEVRIQRLSQVEAAARQIDPQVIINCVGALPASSTPIQMMRANALGPHVLAALGIPMVHMSTDCVYSGLDYPRKDRPDPQDAYGRSKLAGESREPHVVNVRGSFIGPNHGFLRWLLDARGEIELWNEAWWSGGLVGEMARALVSLAEALRMGQAMGKKHSNVLHVAAPEPVTKAAMGGYLIRNLGLPVIPRYVDQPRILRGLIPDMRLEPVGVGLSRLVYGERKLAAAEAY